MGQRHFGSDFKPILEGIVDEIDNRLRRRGGHLIEAYVTGGYARALCAQHAATGEPDVAILIAQAAKTRGDVDLLVYYSNEGAMNPLDVAALSEELNDQGDESDPGGKDFRIDLWVTCQPIVPRAAPMVRIYPDRKFFNVERAIG